MDSDKKKAVEEEETPSKDEGVNEQSSKSDDAQESPADALSRTPEDLEQEEEAREAEEKAATPEEPIKKMSPIKRFFHKVNVYFLFFIILVIVAGAIAAVNYLNSQKAPVAPDIASQDLTEDALKQLANTDASVGNTSQTLTIQGNAIIAGQTLMRGNLNVAGNLQTGGSVQAPSITISGAANLGTTQINSLQVATNTAVQGTTTLRDLNVAGTSSFGGAMTASQITVTRLILSGNAVLEVPNHVSFTGASPSRSINNAVLGSGGTLSVNGSDTAGAISISTGNNPTPGCFGRITFQQVFPTQPRVIVSPVGAGAGLTQYYVERSTTGFNICTNNAAPANQTFAFDYFVMF